VLQRLQFSKGIHLVSVLVTPINVYISILIDFSTRVITTGTHCEVNPTQNILQLVGKKLKSLLICEILRRKRRLKLGGFCHRKRSPGTRSQDFCKNQLWTIDSSQRPNDRMEREILKPFIIDNRLILNSRLKPRQVVDAVV
jgi:hypothetical protein